MADSNSGLPILEFEEQIVAAVRSNAVTVVIGATGSGKSTQLPQILFRAGLARKGREKGRDSASQRVSRDGPEAERTAVEGEGARREKRVWDDDGRRSAREERNGAEGRGGGAGRGSGSETEGRGELAIAVTQPRRVAAVSVARRVSEEMGVQLGAEVGYVVRFEDRSSPSSRIVFQTDGCLLRELQGDPMLLRYGAVVLDEAHERSINTDILFGLLKHLVVARQGDLKLIITSATLDGQKFSKFFGDCPVVEVPGRLHPVQIFYSTERPSSYFQSAVETTMDIHEGSEPGDILVFLTGQEEIERAIAALRDKLMGLPAGKCMDAILLPLHASLPPEQQVRVFSPAPPGCRRIIVSTNVAETAVTLDGIVFVVDPGFVKQKQYDAETQLAALQVVPISRVQAIQRAGRAGRTRPGSCFRLYPKSVFDHELPAVTEPEIRRSSLAATVLHLKSLRLPGAGDVLSFEFLDPPKRSALEDALQQLYAIGCIDGEGKISTVGREAAGLPLDPSLAVTLLAAAQHSCLPDAIIVAAMLSAEINLPSSDATRNSRIAGDKAVRLPDGDGFGDHIRLLQLFREWERVGFKPAWCKQRDIQIRSMQFARDVAKQLRGAVAAKLLSAATKTSSDRDERRGSEREREEGYRAVRKALCIGYGCKLAQRMSRHNGYRTVHARSRLVEVHPSAAPLSIDDDGLLPEWLVYHEIVATSRAFMRGVCVVEGGWVHPILPRLQLTDVNKLSGGKAPQLPLLPAQPQDPNGAEEGPKTATSAVDAARERYLARKKLKK